MGRQTQALVLQLDAACRAADDLAAATAEAFALHPDAAIVNSFPGIGRLTGARVLAEIGDDHPVPRRAGLEVLRRIRADHRRVRQEPARAPSQGQEPAARRRRLRVDLRALPSHRSNSTTTAAGRPVTSTQQRCATCSAGSSAASTTAYRPASSLIRPKPSRTQQQRRSRTAAA